MCKEKKMFDKIKDLVPDGIVVEQIKSELSIPTKKMNIWSRRGFSLKPSESQLTREQAIELYNKIRQRMPEIIFASFQEEKDLEWEFELSFFVKIYHA